MYNGTMEQQQSSNKTIQSVDMYDGPTRQWDNNHHWTSCTREPVTTIQSVAMYNETRENHPDNKIIRTTKSSDNNHHRTRTMKDNNHEGRTTTIIGQQSSGRTLTAVSSNAAVSCKAQLMLALECNPYISGPSSISGNSCLMWSRLFCNHPNGGMAYEEDNTLN